MAKIETARAFSLLHMLKCIYRGQTPGRILMNAHLSRHTLRGVVIDVGGGHRPDYYDYFKQDPGMELTALDGSMQGIDFEKDRLPFEDRSVDTIIFCNVLEHVYNYPHLLAEMRRVLAPGGTVIGWVHYWCNYHPDPHDYFRFSHEALEKIFAEAGFARAELTRVGRSPIYANLENIILSVPHIVRPFLYLWYVFLDKIFLALRPASAKRCPIGFLFILS